MGQQSTFNQDDADTICAGLAEGHSLRAACEAAGLKHSTFLGWCEVNPSLGDQYARARATGRALRFESLREIVASEPERDEKGRIDPGWVAWKRLHVDTEKWALAKEEPKKYGDATRIEHSGNIGIADRLKRAAERLGDDDQGD